MNHITCILNDPATAQSVLQTGQLLSQRLGEGWFRVLLPRPARDPDFMPTEEVMTDERRDRFARLGDARSIELNQQFATWKSSIADSVVLEEVEGDVSKIVAVAAREAALVVAGAAYGQQGEAAAAI